MASKDDDSLDNQKRLNDSLDSTVNEVFEEKKTSILELRYQTNVAELIGQVRKKLPWASAINVEERVDAKLYELLGERTESDAEKPLLFHTINDDEKDKAAPEKPEDDLNPFLIFPNPKENSKEVHIEIPFSDGTTLSCCNERWAFDAHWRVTQGKVRTRFAPVPNKYLHIGHAKAMFINFGLAKDRGGKCLLRYDDINPETELMHEYIEHIKEIVRSMGWEPYMVSRTSRYFQELYEFAVKLISSGHAYVDHLMPDEIKEYRQKKLNSPWRDRPISDSLKHFKRMKRGRYSEEGATLRMKQDTLNENSSMHDTIAYTIKYAPHYSEDGWCIYPSSEFAHCIMDSIQNITHSLCTPEFETRRASYYWLLHSLGIYQPHVREFSRLNISNTVMSKRKLNRLVTENWVDGWDDPRLMTLAGLQRRGITSTAINSFFREIGITRSVDDTLISLERLEYHVREELNKTAPCAMVVLQPLKVVLTNLHANSVISVDAKKRPDDQADDSSAFYKIPFSRVVYIDGSQMHGLAVGKSVMLRYAYPIKCTKVVLANDGETILEFQAEYDPSKETTKPKEVLDWVAQPSPGVDPLKVEVRLFDKLFLSESPAELDDWLDDLNPESKVVIPNAFGIPSLRTAKVGDRFKFQRLGYFVVDQDSTWEKRVFNRTVTLKDN